MRIIAGSAKGRRLFSPSKQKRNLIRPTADRAREALFNIIGSKVNGAVILDLFAGTGALGLEALSRGAASALFVDQHHEAISLINKNLAACSFLAVSTVLKRNLAGNLSFLRQYCPEQGFSIIFLDPPYKKGLGLKTLVRLGTGRFVTNCGLVIVEEDAGCKLPAEAGLLHLYDQRCYGETGFWLYHLKRIEKNV